VRGTHGYRPAEPAAPCSLEPDESTTRWRWLALGFVAAAVAHLFLPCNFTWFLCALPHEMGHASVGCLLGHPSAPAIALHGEAWTGIAELRGWLVWVMAAAAATGAYLVRARLPACIALGITALAIPPIAFSPVSSVLISAGGHLGELAFAAYCYHLCWTGGRTDTPQERIACAMAGALIQTTNLRLCFGLLSDAGARAHYASSGSLGMKNDYLVLAEDLCGCQLQSVALLMLFASALALPIGLFTGWRSSRTG
jgi:hypothetical protein